ncbi:uncharacterized protein EDB91DRAFT_1245307 [Suillus paluster]|uniref:uncharacterized protein n=1 Tax=Suillus paluster TaxID=48578 RepID=UPI001B87FB37|nr:uncharacterized protein EDB91DRAFT_1245307 [Suillus paluster]KAG1747822.1 hypothetical protein EDB91DRAFT_1245307 [Suillus paluster]
MWAASPTINLSPVSDTIGVLLSILARSQVMTPDLETTYSRASRSNSNTNYSVTELKDHGISAIIAVRQQQLDAVLHDMSGLEMVMDSIKNLHQQLVEKKDKIIQSMNLHRRLVSALWRLPAEILSHIFVYCLPESEHSPPSKLTAPMLLTRICRRWREVAVAMPILWCRLRLQVDEEDWQQQAFRFDLWLKRTRGRPLSLTLRCDAGEPTKLRKLLQPYMSQISSLSIRFYHGSDKPDIMLADLPTLRELNICIRYRPDCTPTIAHSISQLPSTLRSLKVMGPIFDLEILSSFNPVWAHLTNIEISTRHPNVFLQLLNLCPDLSSITIREGFDHKQALEPFTHTKLQSLRINHHYARTNHLSDLFDALSLPNLLMLEVRYIQPWPHEEFKAFLTRSNCPLESLIFGAGAMTTSEQRAEYVALIRSLEVTVDPTRRHCFD